MEVSGGIDEGHGLEANLPVIFTLKKQAMKRILVPVDFTPLSRHAMDHALRLAATLDADIVALHAYRIPADTVAQTGVSAVDLEEEWVRAERQRIWVLMEEFLADGKPPGIKSTGEPVVVETALVEDYPEEGIRSFTKRFGCHLIVMGTQGAHDLTDGGIGSMTTSLIPFSDVPVLVVPDGAEDRNPNHIVYAIDFQDNDRDTLRFLQYMAQKMEARLTLLHIREHAIFEEPEEYKNFQLTFNDLIEDDHCAFDLVRGVDLAHTLKDYLENRDADWLVLRTRHRGEDGFEPESLTREMAWHARSPLLVFPA